MGDNAWKAVEENGGQVRGSVHKQATDVLSLSLSFSTTLIYQKNLIFLRYVENQAYCLHCLEMY